MILGKTVLMVYVSITISTLFITALSMLEDNHPNEIKDFYSWLFYGLLWPLIWTRELVKFLINFFKN